jgi:hypothetical protein
MKKNARSQISIMPAVTKWTHSYDFFLALVSGSVCFAIFYRRAAWSAVKSANPLAYFADPIYYANLVHNSQLGSPLLGRNLGGPMGQQLNLTAYGFEWVQSWVVSFFAHPANGPWLAMNRFLLFTFFMTGFSAFLAFRWMAINRIASFICSLAFCLIPDHQPYDVGLANMAPMALNLAVIYKISSGTRITELFSFPFTQKWNARKKNAWSICLLFLVEVFQLTAATYYILLTTLLAGSLLLFYACSSGNKLKIQNLLIHIISQISVTLICLGPILISRLSNNLSLSEPSTGDRRPFAAYANGGDFFALFSPFSANSIYAQFLGHLPRVKAFLLEYRSSPITTGSEYIIHSGGTIFIVLLLAGLTFVLIKGKSKKYSQFVPNFILLHLKTLLIIFSLTLGWYLRGGLGTFISFIFPYVRGYARFSALLIFFGIAIVGLVASSFPRKKVRITFIIILTFIALDTVSSIPKINQLTSFSIIHDVGEGELAGAATIAKGISLRTLGIEGTRKLDKVASNKLPVGCTVLELPLVKYPVDFSIGITSYYTYELIKPGLEISKIKWSAGGISMTPNNKFTDSWIVPYEHGNYSGFLANVNPKTFCGILVFRGLQEAFHEAGKQNNSLFGPSNLLTNELVKNFGEPCYSDVQSAVDLYCLRDKKQ